MRFKCTRAATMLAALLMAGLAASIQAGAAPAGDEAHPVPLVEDLKVTRAVSAPNGDYEVVTMFRELTPTSFKMTPTAEAPDDSGKVREISVTRTIRREDWRNARILRAYFHEFDPPEFPGTTPAFSGVMINELRATGRTRVTQLNVEPGFMGPVVAQTLSGVLTRVGSGTVDVSMLVNGQQRTLRAWHVAGRLSEDNDSEDVDYVVLDDPELPLTLRSKGHKYMSSVVKIEFPLPKARGSELERELEKDRKALVYGIYFNFAQSTIRPVSDPVLKEIAAVMKRNPQWKLSIAGHTDNVGGDASNLALSRKRAAAVKTALVERYGIEAGRLSSSGYGASQPQAKNDTPEGRARNRRVELTRQ